MKKDNVVLIGMSGAGKSTLGVLAAKALGMDFLDTDIVIQQKSGRKLQEIIDNDGIDAFLEKEEKIILELDVHNTVVATGGSAVYSSRAMEHLSHNSTIVYLYVPLNELESRITNIKTRGIVMKPGSSIGDVYRQRLPLYKKYAKVTVDCTKSDIETSVGEIVASVEGQ